MKIAIKRKIKGFLSRISSRRQSTSCRENSLFNINAKLFNARDPHIHDIPNTISIETVRGCFLKCRHCALRVVDKKPRFMDFDLFKYIIDQLPQDGVRRNIHLTNLGETLLYPNLLDAIKYVKESGHKVSLVTNGVLLSKELTEELLKLKLDHIVCSVDGFKKETYEYIRQGAQYERVLSNILHYVYRRNQLFPEGIVQVQTIYSKETKDQIADYRNFWNDLNVVTGVLAMHNWNIKEDSNGVNIDEKYLNFSQKRYPCSLLWNAALINYKGQPLLCSNDFVTNFSNIKDKPLKETYVNDLLAFRKDQIESKYEIEPCKNCTVWPDCAKYLGEC